MRGQPNIFKHPAVSRQPAYKIHFHGTKLRRYFGLRDCAISGFA